VKLTHEPRRLSADPRVWRIKATHGKPFCVLGWPVLQDLLRHVKPFHLVALVQLSQCVWYHWYRWHPWGWVWHHDVDRLLTAPWVWND